MNDSISRQNAIAEAKLLCEGCYLSEHCGKCSASCYVRQMVNKLEKMPPNNSEILNSSDTISRQELLNRTINNPLHSPYITERDVMDCPSVQPRDECGYWDSESSFCALHKPFALPGDECKYWDSESSFCTLHRPSAQPEWEELLVICDNCGHAIHVKQH